HRRVLPPRHLQPIRRRPAPDEALARRSARASIARAHARRAVRAIPLAKRATHHRLINARRVHLPDFTAHKMGRTSIGCAVMQHLYIHPLTGPFSRADDPELTSRAPPNYQCAAVIL